jgi:hypothetical protein
MALSTMTEPFLTQGREGAKAQPNIEFEQEATEETEKKNFHVVSARNASRSAL